MQSFEAPQHLEIVETPVQHEDDPPHPDFTEGPNNLSQGLQNNGVFAEKTGGPGAGGGVVQQGLTPLGRQTDGSEGTVPGNHLTLEIPHRIQVFELLTVGLAQVGAIQDDDDFCGPGHPLCSLRLEAPGQRVRVHLGALVLVMHQAA